MAKVTDAPERLRRWAELLDKRRPEVLDALGPEELRVRLEHVEALNQDAMRSTYGPTSREFTARAQEYLCALPHAEYERKMAEADDRLSKCLASSGTNAYTRDVVSGVAQTRARLRRDNAYAYGTKEAAEKDKQAASRLGPEVRAESRETSGLPGKAAGHTPKVFYRGENT